MPYIGTKTDNKKELQKVKSFICKHNINNTDCFYCWRNYCENDIEWSSIQPIRRSRMFSQNSCVPNVREFCKQILKNRKDTKAKNVAIEDSKFGSNIEDKNLSMMNQQQLDEMKIIHRDLIEKTSKLVDRAKKSQFLGFFSPRRLRNRIKIGNFSQIACIPAIVKRRAFSPIMEYSNLNNTGSTIDFDKDKKCRNNSLYDKHFVKSTNQNSYSKCKKQNLNLVRIQNSKCNVSLNINEEFILSQHEMKNNFQMTNKFILS